MTKENTMEMKDDLVLYTNLSKKETGLPMVVWIQVKNPLQNCAPRMKFANNTSDSLVPDDLVPISISENPQIQDDTELKISRDDFEALRHWIILNRENLLQVWESKMDSQDFGRKMTMFSTKMFSDDINVDESVGLKDSPRKKVQSTVFELLEIEIYTAARRAVRRAETNRIGIYLSEEAAEKDLRIIARKRQEEKDCYPVLGYILNEFTVNEPERLVSMRSYTYDGKHNDKNLMSPLDGSFSGRPSEMVRFHQGDIVEAYHSGTVEIMIVDGTPMTTEWYAKIREKAESLGRWDKFMYGSSDDMYTLLPVRGEYHAHVQSQLVYAPTHPIPKKMQEELKKQLKEFS